MAANAHILSSLQMVTSGGTFTGKQGIATNDIRIPLAVSVTGDTHVRTGSVAVDAVATIYDATVDDLPATWALLFLWADAAMQVQLMAVTPAHNVVLRLLPFLPLILGHGNMLAAADNTALTAGGDTLVAIDRIAVTGITGESAPNYNLLIIL